MPRSTTITSERARELGRKGAAAVDRDPVTHRFRKRATPGGEPGPDPAPSPEPDADEPSREDPAPSFESARRRFGQRRRA